MKSYSNPSGKMINSHTFKLIKMKYPDSVIVIDNSWLSPLFYNPGKYHVDVIVESLSKYIGAGNVIMDMVTSTKKENESY